MEEIGSKPAGQHPGFLPVYLKHPKNLAPESKPKPVPPSLQIPQARENKLLKTA